jgi:hypothetical protein
MKTMSEKNKSSARAEFTKLAFLLRLLGYDLGAKLIETALQYS